MNRTTTQRKFKSPFVKDLYMIGLICLATLLMTVGMLVCFSTSGSQQFFIGVMVVGVGFVLFSLVVSFFKGGS